MSALDRPIVVTAHGPVQGVWRGNSAAFLGIPFAQPPVGNLRFAAPVPHKAWTELLDASEHGPTPQRVPYAPETLIPEPCIPGESTLNVNVFTPTPKSADGTGLPVMVFFHGGAYVAGSPASPWYDGAGFNENAVVTVTVSYRLGFDGFGWISDAPHNRAVLDWLLALEWVQENIAAFGGDPAQVTLAGQSAGGGAALTLLTMPRAQHLFARVISLSGVTTTQTLATAQEYGTRLAALGQVTPTRSGLASLTELEIIDLQNQLAQEAAADDPLADLFTMARSGLVLAPYVDGDVIPHPTIAGIEHGIGADKDLLLGSADQEFNANLVSAGPLLENLSTDQVLSRLGISPSAATAYLQSHPGLTQIQTVGQAISDLLFRVWTVRVAQARCAQDPRSLTWVYRFGWVSPTLGFSNHCLDLPFFFNATTAAGAAKLVGDTPPQSLVRDLHGTAASFIHGRSPQWQPWTKNTRQAYLFAVPGMVISNAYTDIEMLTAN